jgi:hypothetical protein
MPRSANCNSLQVRMWVICKEFPKWRTGTLQWKFKTQNIYRPFFESWKSLWERSITSMCYILYLHCNFQCIIFAYSAATWNDTSRSNTFVLHTLLLLAMRLTKYYICTLLVRANETLIFPWDSLPEICGPKTSFGCSTWTFLNLTNVLCISNIKTAKCNMEEYTMLDCWNRNKNFPEHKLCFLSLNVDLLIYMTL